ncbi:glycosyltransferase [Streptomyces sp. NPDC088925]|uniref:glycosyltransferase n=1 Tax=Streptomyces sp. NPDC088925 TaxID=3365914 RepID=UPI0037FEBD8E
MTLLGHSAINPGTPGGAIEVFRDLYSGYSPAIPGEAFMLGSPRHSGDLPRRMGLLNVGIGESGADYRRSVSALRRALLAALDGTAPAVLHLHYLTFAGTEALLQAFPHTPRIAFVHGADVLAAERDRDHHDTLRETVRRAETIVIPNESLARKVVDLSTPAVWERIEVMPWGIPDHLVSGPAGAPPAPSSTLRLLYAGRADEPGLLSVLRALGPVGGVALHVMTPGRQRVDLSTLKGKPTAYLRPQFTGPLPRHRLWSQFTAYDALVLPTTGLETTGRLALEAQACGLPVIYQPTRWLRTLLGNSGWPLDFADRAAVTADMRRLRRSAVLLPALRAAGRENAARYRLSAMAATLHRLGAQLT